MEFFRKRNRGWIKMRNIDRLIGRETITYLSIRGDK